MGYGPSDCRIVGEVISSLFGATFVINELSPVSSGVNAGVHLKASATNGEVFGLKQCSLTGSENGIEKEKLMSDTALTTGMPNPCRAELSDNLGFIEVFKDQKVCLIKWLKDSTTLKKLDGEVEWVNLLDSADDFHFQVGIWMSFGYMMGIPDRNLGNWVWTQDKKLSMIDMEFALHQPSFADFNELLGRYVTKRADLRKEQLVKVLQGFHQGVEQIVSNTDEVVKLFQAYSFSQEYELPTASFSNNGIVEHLKAYGLA